MRLIACAGVIVALLAGDAAAAEPDGKALFASLCTPCHGDDGAGHTPLGRKWGIPDFGTADWQGARTDDAIAAAVRGGRPGTRMRPFGGRLTEAEIVALVRQIRSLR